MRVARRALFVTQLQLLICFILCRPYVCLQNVFWSRVIAPKANARGAKIYFVSLLRLNKHDSFVGEKSGNLTIKLFTIVGYCVGHCIPLPSVCIYAHVSVCYPSIFLSLCLSICASTHWSVHLSAHQSTSVCPSIYLSISLSVFLSTYARNYTINFLLL